MKQQVSSVSVALCTYNGARYLQAQLDSIAAQTILPAEVVVGDDGSTDETLAVIEASRASAPFEVRVLEVGRFGPTGNFLRTAAACEGEVIFFCDQDDWWRPYKVEATLARLREPGVVCAISDALLVNAQGRSLGRMLWQQLGYSHDGRGRLDAERAQRWLLRRTLAFGAVMAFDRALLDVALPAPETPWGHDNMLALIAATRGEVALIDEPLIHYRQHQAQVSSAWRGGLLARLRHTPSATSVSITPTAASFDALAARLGPGVLPDAMRAKAAHMRAREVATTHTLTRPARVAAELLRGRYHQHSNGLLSAARDLAGR